jgi:hypothetical protein
MVNRMGRDYDSTFAERLRTCPDTTLASAAGDLEIYSSRVVGFAGGGQIDIGQLNFVGAIVGEIKECVANDCVVLQLSLMSIPENYYGVGLGYDWGRRFGSGDWLGRWRWFAFYRDYASPTCLGTSTVKNCWSAIVVLVVISISGVWLYYDHLGIRYTVARKHASK